MADRTEPDGAWAAPHRATMRTADLDAEDEMICGIATRIPFADTEPAMPDSTGIGVFRWLFGGIALVGAFAFIVWAVPIVSAWVARAVA